jgi:hypothetical protein
MSQQASRSNSNKEGVHEGSHLTHDPNATQLQKAIANALDTLT